MVFEGLNNLISTFCVCADYFQGLSKASYYPIQLLTFICFLDINLPILKMLIETLLRILFTVTGPFSLGPISYWLQDKCPRNNLSQYQNRRCRVFEAGYWKDFQNFKGASYNFEFDFFIN
jgi:hypothetical protein